jgi:hypothetical protein
VAVLVFWRATQFLTVGQHYLLQEISWINCGRIWQRAGYEYFMYLFFSSIGNQIFDMAKHLSVRLNDVMKIVAVFISFLKSF